MFSETHLLNKQHATELMNDLSFDKLGEGKRPEPHTEDRYHASDVQEC